MISSFLLVELNSKEDLGISRDKVLGLLFQYYNKIKHQQDLHIEVSVEDSRIFLRLVYIDHVHSLLSFQDFSSGDVQSNISPGILHLGLSGCLGINFLRARLPLFLYGSKNEDTCLDWLSASIYNIILSEYVLAIEHKSSPLVESSIHFKLSQRIKEAGSNICNPNHSYSLKIRNEHFNLSRTGDKDRNLSLYLDTLLSLRKKLLSNLNSL
jgi:hypothetical protein